MQTAHAIQDAPTVEVRLTQAAASLGYEIVDIAGFLDLLDDRVTAQAASMTELQDQARAMLDSNQAVRRSAEEVSGSTEAAFALLEASLETLSAGESQVRALADWVGGLAERLAQVRALIAAVDRNNLEISNIAAQVSILAINAKIESARAGDAGRGFGVVAEEIGRLSQRTADAAESITDNSEGLVAQIAALSDETAERSAHAREVNDTARQTGEALKGITDAVGQARANGQTIAEAAAGVGDQVARFGPTLHAIGEEVADTALRVHEVRDRTNRLIDSSEGIVQATAAMGLASADTPFIDYVRSTADRISGLFDQAVDAGRITAAALFDETYRQVPGTDPPQYLTAFTGLTDTLLQDLLEAALGFDPKVVFCAAVDRNGYLPTHNLKFSQPQGADVAWNTAHCRNRRMFDDRVGLKAGRNAEPFLLQVYRRDMGGGAFAMMMKDLSAPIRVQGRYRGGLRMGYKF